MYFSLFIFLSYFLRISGFDTMNLKSIYYQIYSNHYAYRVQNQSECVVSQFSNPREDSSIGFLFQGIKNNSILKMYGDIELSQRRFLRHDNTSICFHMNVSSFSNKNKEICFLEYDEDLNWILISDPQLRLLHGMVHNRSSLHDTQHLYNSFKKYEENNMMVYDMNCKYFDPPSLG